MRPFDTRPPRPYLSPPGRWQVPPGRCRPRLGRIPEPRQDHARTDRTGAERQPSRQREIQSVISEKRRFGAPGPQLACHFRLPPCKNPIIHLYVYYRLWPDNRAVSLLALPGARSDSLSKTSTNRVEVTLCAAFAHVHLHQSRKVTPMIMGTVKFYNDMKGFGFIQPDDGSKDVFVHATALERAGIRGLSRRPEGFLRHGRRPPLRQDRRQQHPDGLTMTGRTLIGAFLRSRSRVERLFLCESHHPMVKASEECDEHISKNHSCEIRHVRGEL